jgi:hypothetical protein
VRPYLKKNPSQKRAGRVTQGVGLEFKYWYCKKKKNSTPERAGRVVQVIECLPSKLSKCEALSSSPSTAKKKKREGEFLSFLSNCLEMTTV